MDNLNELLKKMKSEYPEINTCSKPKKDRWSIFKKLTSIYETFAIIFFAVIICDTLILLVGMAIVMGLKIDYPVLTFIPALLIFIPIIIAVIGTILIHLRKGVKENGRK